MDSEDHLRELFAHEDQARELARRLMELAQRDPGAAAAERAGLVAFVRGALEQHMAHEERAIFPLLVEHGLGPEVDVARKQHAALRDEVAHLATATSAEDAARGVFLVARMMLHHTNFEGDYIYPELSRGQWTALMAATRTGS
jgi:hypothetical protein